MITSSELFAIGYVSKTHGIKGELNMRLDTEFNPEDFKFLIFDIDSIFVPFQIALARGKGEDNRIVSLVGVNTVEEARQFVGKNIYVLLKELKEHPLYRYDNDEENLYLSDLVGYHLVDENESDIGEIIGFNDDTQNFLLEVKTNEGKVIFIPYVEEWLTRFDQDNKILGLDLPTGLID